MNESAYVFKALKADTSQKVEPQAESSREQVLEELTREMLEAADNLEFERAAYLRDQIKLLKKRR